LKVIYLKQDAIYVNEDDRVVKKEFSYEKGVVTASIGYNHILNITFKLPKTIEKDMLEIEAEKYVFTEGSLDYSKEYKINYIFKEYEDYYNVEVYAIETNKLKKEFETFLKVYKYIDFISAKPFIFGAYYDIVKNKSGNDVFIYFERDEAFLSCFENGEFLFVKSISKLSTLAKQLDKSVEETIELLKEKGLNEEQYENSEIYNIIDSFFSQFFMKVNNLINYSVSYYSLSKIERIFFYSPFEINGLFETYTDFWNLSGIEFKKYEVPSDYDAFDYTAVIFNTKNYTNENLNFSIFPKPLPFYKTRSGLLVGAILICVSVLAGDMYYKCQVINRQTVRIDTLKKKFSRKKRELKLLKQAIIKYEKQINSVKSENTALKNQISDISDKILFLNRIEKKTLVSNQLADLINTLKKYDLKIVSFTKTDSHTDLEIISKFNNSSNIARFMKELKKLGYKNIASKLIENSNGIYISKVSYDE